MENILKDSFSESTILSEAKKAVRKPPLIVILLVLLAAFTAESFLTNSPMLQLFPPLFQSAVNMLATAPADIALSVVFIRCIEKRSLKSIGITGKHAGILLLRGCLIGFISFCATIGILLFGGTAEISLAPSAGAGIFLFYLGVYLLQGFSEEIIFRGFLLVSEANRTSVTAAILISAFFYASAHVFGTGFSALSFLNLFIDGIYAAMFLLYDDSILCIGGIHALWNFSEGDIFGCQVSGYTGDPNIFQIKIKPGYELINGGLFGPEGGLTDTVIEFSMLLIILILVRKRAADRSAGKNRSVSPHSSKVS